MHETDADDPLNQLDAPPIFIVGLPRSGTTWVADALAAHPQVARVPSETWLFSLLSAFAPYVEEEWDGGARVLNVTIPPPQLAREIRLFASRVFARALRPESRFLVEKSPDHMWVIPFMMRVFSDSRVVHVVRDGRDVFVSRRAASRSWGATLGGDWYRSTARTALGWKKGLRRVDRDAESLDGRVMEIRYEEMKSDPDASIRRLLDFCRIPYDDELVGHINSATQFENVHQTDETGFYRGGRVGDWRTHMNILDGLIFNLVAGDELIRRGYESNRRWLAPVVPRVRKPPRLLARAERLEERGMKGYTDGSDQTRATRDLQEALRIFDKLGNSERTGRLNLRVGFAYSTFPDAVDARRARRHLEAATPDGIPVSAGLETFYTSLGDASAAIWERRTAEGISSSARAIEIAKGDTPNGLAAHAEAVYAWHLSMSGHPREAVEILERVGGEAEGPTEPLVRFLATWFGATIALHGRWDPAGSVSWCDQALDWPATTQTPTGHRILLELGARGLILQGEIAAARKRLPGEAARSSVTAALLELYSGDIGASERAFWRMMGDAQERGNVELQDICAYFLTDVLRLRGKVEEARKLRESWLADPPSAGPVWAEMMIRWQLAELEIDAERPDRAERHLHRCHELLGDGEEWGAREAKVASIDARLAAARGDLGTADERFRFAVETFERYHLAWERVRTLDDWAHALSAAGQTDRATESANRAIESYRRLGAGAFWVKRARPLEHPAAARN